MSNPLQNLKIDYWYKALLVIGVVILITSLTVELKGVSNTIVQLLSLASIFIGIGEWINHPLREAVVQPSVYTPGGGKITGYPRKNSPLGILFDVVGIVLAIVGVIKLF